MTGGPAQSERYMPVGCCTGGGAPLRAQADGLPEPGLREYPEAAAEPATGYEVLGAMRKRPDWSISSQSVVLNVPMKRAASPLPRKSGIAITPLPP